MSEMVIDDLICGYTVIIVDEPERVTSPYGKLSIPMRITHSPVYFVVRLNNGGSAFRGTLSPINIKPGNARTKAIESAILEWVMKYIEIVETRYNQNTEKVCGGSCQSRVCFGKPSPE